MNATSVLCILLCKCFDQDDDGHQDDIDNKKVEKNIYDDDYKKKKNDERILRVCPEGSSKPEELLQTCTGLVIA